MDYHHTATLTVNAATTKDANGDFLSGAPTTTTTICRDEPNSSGRSVESDGTTIVYSSMVYFPADVVIEKGMGIVVSTGLSGVIRRVDKNRFHTRAWV